jgi:16S rRNA (uracil1498-N3)-methyltransferase
MHLFFAEHIFEHRVLPLEESFHCVKVLRLKENDAIQIVDGKGGYYEAKIVSPDAKGTKIEIVSVKQEFEKRTYQLHLAIAPTKNIDRFEWFVEKAVEIGIDSVTPLICRFSERKNIKAERLNKIVIAAAKQSLKAYLPQINPITEFSRFISNIMEKQRFIAHCHSTEKEHLLNICKKELPALVMIGPEGDFSAEEVKAAEHRGFKSVSLGTSRLRTETAGVVACHTVSVINN